MGEDAHAADGFRRDQCRPQSKHQERSRVALTLERYVNSKLAEQCGGYRVRPIALLGPGKKRALDLRGAQGDVSGDLSGRGIGDDVHAGNATGLVGPGVTAEPSVERFPAAVKRAPVVRLGQRARWGDERDRSGFPGRC